MTPEQAREIDRQEFEADALRLRQFVHVAIHAKHVAEHARIARWLATDPKDGKRRLTKARPFAPQAEPIKIAPTHSAIDDTKPKRNGRLRTANGRTMTVRQWADELGISVNNLHQRIHINGSLEAAIAKGGPRYRRTGALKNFAPLKGTGGGSHAQDITEIEISK